MNDAEKVGERSLKASFSFFSYCVGRMWLPRRGCINVMVKFPTSFIVNERSCDVAIMWIGDDHLLISDSLQSGLVITISSFLIPNKVDW